MLGLAFSIQAENLCLDHWGLSTGKVEEEASKQLNSSGDAGNESSDQAE